MAIARVDVKGLQNGQHVCLCYRSEAERQEVLGAFVSDGLAANAKVYYFAHREPVADVLTALHWTGIDSAQFISHGNLVVQTAYDSYLRTGVFDSDECMRNWIATIDAALSEGYSGIRVAADMSWVLDGIPGSDRLLDYERALSGLVFLNRPLIGLCEFDERLFDPQTVHALRAAHRDGEVLAPALVNTQRIRIYKSFTPPGLRVEGAIVGATQGQFEAASRHIANTTAGDIQLDLTMVDEIDAGGLQAIIRIARELYFGRHLILAGGGVLRDLDLSAAQHLRSLRFEQSA